MEIFREGGDPPSHGPLGFELDAESTWVVVGSVEEVEAVVADLGGVVCRRLGRGMARLRFGNSVGRIHRAGPLGPLVVCSGKWREEDFDTLLADLSRIAASLPFAANAVSSLPYERTELTGSVLYHAFVWLRHALLGRGDLPGALDGILRNPHRRLIQTRRVVPTALAGRPAHRSWVDIAAGRWPLVESHLGFSVGDRRVLPLEIEEDGVRESADNAENRFVKAFLAECAWVIDEVCRHLPRANPRLRQEAGVMARMVERWQQAVLWREVGPLIHVPAGSSVLQRRTEYRVVLQHHAWLRLGARVPLDEAATEKLLESKDIAALYELWAAFAVLEVTQEILGRPAEVQVFRADPHQLNVGRGLLARWGGGIELAYNATFTRRGGFHGVSRSLALRPDVALFLPSGPSKGLHLFDAKFRLDGPLPSESQDEGTAYKSSDLHKMHAYRDALPAARSAWVLYPGSKAAAFLDEDGQPGAMSGVGALPLQPGGEHRELRRLIEDLRPTPS